MKHLTLIPFAGFYNSTYDGEFDTLIEQEADRMTDTYPQPPGPISARDYAEILFDNTDFHTAMHYVASKYPTYLADLINDEFDLDLTLEFDSLESPKFYNFETDRIFAKVSHENLVKMHDLIPPDRLQNTIDNHLKSRSGFISFYSEFVTGWKTKPLEEWDSNECSMLLYALLSEVDDWSLSVYYKMCERNVFDQAFDASVNWGKVSERVNEIVEGVTK